MLKNIKVYNQNDKLLDEGFDNCDSKLNGEFFIVDHFIKNDMIVFDIGANVGFWSKYVKSKYENKIHCFEPVKSTYDILCDNFKDTNIKCNNYAVSNNNNDKTFYFYGETILQLSELSSLYKRSDDIEKRFGLNSSKMIVKCITVNDYCQNNNIEKINFLKIDTEGAEMDVLVGCSSMLDNIDLIQFEYGGCYLDSNKTLKEAYNILKNKFDLYRILSDGLLFIEKWNDNLENYLYSNYLAIKK